MNSPVCIQWTRDNLLLLRTWQWRHQRNPVIMSKSPRTVWWNSNHCHLRRNRVVWDIWWRKEDSLHDSVFQRDLIQQRAGFGSCEVPIGPFGNVYGPSGFIPYSVKTDNCGHLSLTCNSDSDSLTLRLWYRIWNLNIEPLLEWASSQLVKLYQLHSRVDQYKRYLYHQYWQLDCILL